MSLPYKFDDRTAKDDGFNPRNWGISILLVASYVALVLIGAMIAGYY